MADYWNHNTAYHRELVAVAVAVAVGSGGRILDVGCGDGLLVQKLAATADHVIGIDPDESAVARAHARLAATPNVDILVGDVLDSAQLDGQRFDLITCVATLHHLPLVPALERLRELLAPQGRLHVVGLAANKSARDWLISGALLLPIRLMSTLHRESDYPAMTTARPRESLEEIRDAATVILPGCRINRRLYYRYTLTWRKPPT